MFRTLMYCGGYDGNYHRSCHSYQLGEEEMGAWKAEPGMVHARYRFTLSLVGNKVYAIGGTGEVNQDTVESYTEEAGWALEVEMRMDKYRYYHCSVTWESKIIVIGGYYGPGSGSNSMQAIDTHNKTAGWTSMESMKTVRMAHGCDVWVYEGQPGIVVAGGSDGKDYLSSVEFYFYEGKYWTTLASLVTKRCFHSLTVVSGQLAVAGGYKGGYNPSTLTSIEFSNLTESDWTNVNNLKTARARHSGVS